MTPSEESFVADMGAFLSSAGMPPMAGRMWGWLLICDPREQTAEELADELQASRGAISGAARLLATAGLIRRTSRRGDRREYFSVPPGTFMSLIGEAGAVFQRFVDVSGRGLALLVDRPIEDRQALQEVHDAYAFFAREVPALIQRFKDERIPPV